MSGIHEGTSSFALYAAIVRGLQLVPMTAREIAQEHDIRACSARAFMREMQALGIVQVVEHRRVGAAGPRDRVFAVDRGLDLTPPTRKVRPRAAIITFGALWQALQEPSTAVELIDETGLGHQAIYRFLAQARAIGLVHVAGWTRRGYIPVATYALGCKRDSPRPARDCNADVKRRFRQRESQRRQMAILGGLAA